MLSSHSLFTRNSFKLSKLFFFLENLPTVFWRLSRRSFRARWSFGTSRALRASRSWRAYNTRRLHRSWQNLRIFSTSSILSIRSILPIWPRFSFGTDRSGRSLMASTTNWSGFWSNNRLIPSSSLSIGCPTWALRYC
uniref:Candidate secreted effector n=1 Tax=Meloidogyne incognita TaxID=6306 RepID=A0A914LR41_MELIC